LRQVDNYNTRPSASETSESLKHHFNINFQRKV